MSNTIRKDITLFDNQKEHVEKLLNILNTNYYALDFSMLGTGKTYSSSYIYQTLIKDNKIKNIIVIAPKSVQTKWIEMEKNYNINLYKNISFRTLTGVKFKQPTHGLLKRRDYMKRVLQENGEFRDIEKCDYTVSEEYENKIKEGTLLVIDEIQNIKNVNNQSLACRALIKEILFDFKNGGNSRILLLSGSPIDKQDQVVTFFKNLNIMTDDRLSYMNPRDFTKIYAGMKEIEQYCLRYKTVEKIYKLKYPNKKINKNIVIDLDVGYFDEKKYCYTLFQNVIKPLFSNSMSSKLNSFNIICNNSFYNMNNDNDVELLKKGIKLLKSSTGFNPATGTVNFGRNGTDALVGIQRALIMIETSKINEFYRIVKTELDNNKNCKVVLALNYIQTINDLMILLKEFNPIKIDGSVSTKKRLKAIENFQQDNNDFRLIIANSSTINSGIDLDAKFKGRNRICFLSPNFKTIELYQLAGRFIRADSQEDALLRLVFIKDNEENKILNSIARKSVVMKQTTEQQLKDGIVFPDMYDNWYE